ncbi:MAG: proline dehydrogenase family protein, partial [Candidatus Tectomicrobia bacterium]
MTHKWETDANFERLTTALLENYRLLKPAFATHNIRSIAHAIATARSLGVPERALEFQMLYGMGDEIKAVLGQMKQRLRIYSPYGELIPGMGYLVRRLLENTSNDSFLRQSLSLHQSVADLLHSPEEERRYSEELSTASASEPRPEPGRRGSEWVRAISEGNGRRRPFPAVPPSAFHNEPELDFTLEENRQAFAQALNRVRSQLG